MSRRRHCTASACGGAVIIMLLGVALALPASALAATLAGGRRQAAIARAFHSSRAHKGQVIVSIRLSTVSPNWAIVKSVRPSRGGRGARGQKIRLISTFFALSGGRAHAGSPPPAVSADLSPDFKVAVQYTGSGGETIAYQQLYRSVCAGAGGFVDQESVTVSPMSWRVRYVVDLDTMLAAVRTAQGAALVPKVTFEPAGSQLSATEHITRQSMDAGCNGAPVTYDCTVRFHLPGSKLDGLFSLQSGGGTEIGVPTGGATATHCDPARLILGPSLWDTGGTTALVGRLGLGGGTLPANPYAPISVSWPAGSALFAQSLISSPCQGSVAACSDDFHWRGTVRLQPAG